MKIEHPERQTFLEAIGGLDDMSYLVLMSAMASLNRVLGNFVGAPS